VVVVVVVAVVAAAASAAAAAAAASAAATAAAAAAAGGHCEMFEFKVYFLFSAIAIVLQIAMFVTFGTLYLTGYNILPIFFDDVPMRMTDVPWDARWYAWEDRTKFPGSYKRSGEG